MNKERTNIKEMIENEGYVLQKANEDELAKDFENEHLELEEDNTSLDDLSKEELIQIIDDLMNTKMLNTGNVDGMAINEKSFEKGVEEGSFYAGIYQALTSCGMAMGDAYNLTLNISTSKGNLETAKVNLINVEKQSI